MRDSERKNEEIEIQPNNRKIKRQMGMKVEFTLEHMDKDFNKALEEMSLNGWTIHSWNIIRPGLAFVLYERED